MLIDYRQGYRLPTEGRDARYGLLPAVFIDKLNQIDGVRYQD